MSQYRRMNLLKTLTTTDIEEVLDQYGSEQPMFHPLTCGNEDGDTKKMNHMNIGDTMSGRKEVTGLQEEWDNLFSRKNYIQQLKHACLEGNIGTENFRSICWRIFWECLSENKSSWVEDVREERKRYTEIRNKYVMDPYEKEHVDVGIHHPLSQAEDSVWHQYFQDNELRDTIMQDLNRLFPEIDFFQQDCIKTIILHILFCYARENPEVQYKQGMHEVLAPLIYIMVLNSLAVKGAADEVGEDIKIIMDLKFIEHDAYVLFFNIMESIEPWYTNLRPCQGNQTTAISKKLTRIQCYMLKRYDNALRDHLEKIEVTPQLYGIRWIRLLFGREFSLNRVLILWDAIFADGIDLVDFVYLAMLINLRGVLLQSDFNNCLGHLMKYPANTDTKYILKRAVALKNHKFTDTEIIPSSVANHMENNVCNLNLNGKPIFYSQRVADIPSEQSPESGAQLDCSGMDPSMRTQRTNSLGKQISNIKDKVGATPQIISRLSDTLKTKHQSSTMNTLIEDHAHLQKQVSQLRTQLDKMSTISLFCGGKMDLYISILQQCLLKHETCGELEVHTFAGLKQVRDILKDGLENCGSVPDYEEDFKDIDEHIADASNELTVESNENGKVTAITDTLSVVRSEPPGIGTSEDSNTFSSESCECEDLNNMNIASSEEPVDVLYFDHNEPADHENIQTVNNKTPTVPNKTQITGKRNAVSLGTVTSSPLGNVPFASHMYDDVNCKLMDDDGDDDDDDNDSVGALNSLVEGMGTSSHLDPLSSFQVDLASCIDLSDNFNY